MNRRCLSFAVLLVVAIAWSALAAAPWHAPTLDDVQEALSGLEFDDFVDEAFRLYVLRFPETLTFEGLSSLYGVRNDGLNNYLPDYLLETRAIAKLILQSLNAYDIDALDEEQALTYIIAEQYWTDEIGAEEMFPLHYPVTHDSLASWDAHTVDSLTEVHPFSTIEDIEDYVTRLQQMGKQLDQIVEFLEMSQEAGIVAPRMVLEPALDRIYALKSRATRRHPLYEAFEAKAPQVEDVTAAAVDDYLAIVEETINLVVKPAFQRLYDVVLALRRVAPEGLSMGQFPEGEKVFASLVAANTHTDLSLSVLHESALSAVERIADDIRQLASDLDIHTIDSVKAIVAYASGAESMVSGELAVIEAREDAETAKRFITDLGLFSYIPDVELAIQGSMTKGYVYYPPSLDGLRPASYFVYLNRDLSRPQQYSTAIHETYPGHHLQHSFALELQLPLFRQVVDFREYTEGWAVYGEQLMSEMGAFAENPYADLVRLGDELVLALLAVVNTGIHHLDWELDDIQEYFDDAIGYSGGWSSSLAMAAAAYPARTLAYWIGSQTILELREQAREALGSAFDIKAFHDIVLGYGNVPLSFVRQQVEAWIASEQDL